MSKLSIKSKALVAGAAVVGLAGSGVAYAYWTTSGSGSGTATASSGDNAAFSITDQVSPSPSVLAPNLAGGTLSGKVLNTSTNHANNAVRTVTAVLTVSPVGTNTCDASNYLLKPSGAAGQSAETSTGAYTLSSDNSSGTEVLYVTGASASQVVDLADNAKVPFATNLSFVNKPNTLQDGCKGATVNIAYTTGS